MQVDTSYKVTFREVVKGVACKSAKKASDIFRYRTVTITV